jgi:hypothetical protein
MRSLQFKNIIKNIICIIVMLQMINISINFQQLTPLTAVTKNVANEPIDPEIETLYELIAEGIFDFEIPESEDEAIDNDSINFHLYFYSPNRLVFGVTPIFTDHYLYNYFGSSALQQPPVSPPPKFC